jgi:hypothetical protein
MRRHHPLTYTRSNNNLAHIFLTFLALLAGVIVVLIFFMMLAVFFSVPRAHAHSWYPMECCSGGDCAEIAPSRVKTSAAGYVIDGKFAVPYRDVRQSPDGRFHACFPTPEWLRCFFAPPPGS